MCLRWLRTRPVLRGRLVPSLWPKARPMGTPCCWPQRLLMWACNQDLPVNNLAELVAYAKTRPGQLNYGSAGAGGINHLVLEQLKAQQGALA